MPRKISKKSLIKKCDILWSGIIKIRDRRCIRCGKNNLLNAAHIYSRSNKNVRYDLQNGITLCVGCHFWGHQNPIEFTKFVIKKLGEDKIKELSKKANIKKAMTIKIYSKIWGELKECLNKYIEKE